MWVPSARRLVTALCVLLLAGKGAQRLRLFVASVLGKFRALTAAGAPASPSWRLFSSFLGDLRDHRIGKVLLAGDHCIVQAKDGVETYKVLVPPRTENTYILDALVRSGVEFGSVTPSTSSKLMPVAIALMPFLYLGLTYKMLRGMYGTDAGAVGKDGTKKVRKQQQTERISFDDVAGIDGARKELEEVVDFLRHPARYHAIGAKVPKGNVNGVIVIAATNRPEVLDPALCRPGRFDRHVYVGLPDAKGREEILEVHCRNVKLDSEVDLSVVAEECGPMGQRSGAQLASLVNEAALLAVRHGDTSIKYKHFEQAMNRAFASQTRSIAGSSFEFTMEDDS
ncbi:P-loop containing nucleoside triphosphate hydrolase [Phytophthora cactorum]|nr:P-loop containing nucleoside triphosphate hydrolase [Phytophthora cactorum]